MAASRERQEDPHPPGTADGGEPEALAIEEPSPGEPDGDIVGG